MGLHIREKKNKSGSISVIIVDRNNRGYKAIETIGCAYNQTDLEIFLDIAQTRLKELNKKLYPTLFDTTESELPKHKNLKFVNIYNKRDSLKKSFIEEIKNNKSFEKSISTATGDPNSVKKRYDVVLSLLEKYKYIFDIAQERFAWITNNKQEKKMIRTMKKGSRIMISGYNQQGSQTIDHYSLLGFTKAYSAAKKKCS